MTNLAEQIFTILKKDYFIGVEASGRHVHLSQDAVSALFGKDYVFKKLKDLSQPGQFAAVERVNVISDKGRIDNVAILGPVRGDTQLEISKTDARTLGIDAPLRLSGDIEGTPGITIEANGNSITIDKGVIIAKRHVHLTPETAKKFNVSQGETVRLKIFSSRPLIFDGVVIRISDKFSDFVHIDYDEANACGYTKNTLAFIQKKK